jgi:hypothetical protein
MLKLAENKVTSGPSLIKFGETSERQQWSNGLIPYTATSYDF